MHLSATTVLLLLVAMGCRDPVFLDNPYHATGADFGSGDLYPAPRCPPGSVQKIDNSMSPWEGGDVSPELVVEIFTWMRCGNCAGLSVFLRDFKVRRKDLWEKVRFYFHHFPLDTYDTALEIHENMVAIHRQSNDGFWQAHDWAFDKNVNQEPVLNPEDLEVYARDVLKLDMNEFYAVARDPKTRDFVLWDRGQGDVYDVVGTPTIIICGRHLGGWKHLEEGIETFMD